MDLKNQTQKRTIKFRGQNIKGEWHYGFLSYNKDVSSDYEWFISNKAGKPFAFGAIERSIGQFTGLHDKNGKEIYEKMELNNTFIIKWLNFRYVLFYISDLTIFKEIFDYENKLEITGEYTEL